MWTAGFYGMVASHDECEAIFQVSLNRRHLVTWLINSLGAGISFSFFLFSFFFPFGGGCKRYHLYIHTACILHILSIVIVRWLQIYELSK
ncbi:hypothetical protein CI102_6665 [Trichoderma harzianum]|uniref:Uncharacterized protein n=1 Tax=Trichoderma harzianum CBS 226.95 TaxID=983964 RepID=A0A2T4ADZ1_TRIHA|nr:hypothetical protein M431DRAFT_397350 [Trichoderma harzianum CBS 226.95]PKK50085.1 hypothetical protein CI102_6665 [Trichoderma harzianum]PTB55289.1 hypothetical protein M431DRAFT_397350 [Trichoderma harzianum CBS 226.95]